MNSPIFSYLFLVPLVAGLVAILGKGLFSFIAGEFSLRKMLSSGGMPSFHTALVTSLTTAIGIKYGIFSDEFLICSTFSFLFIYDAMNVRFEAGEHARVLNEITGKKYHFNESIGHLPEEAFVGSIIGISTAALLLTFDPFIF